MPCIPIPNGFLCVGNEPVAVTYRGKQYLFEWTAWCGWIPLNKDGSERLSRVPNAVWNLLPKHGGHDATNTDGWKPWQSHARQPRREGRGED